MAAVKYIINTVGTIKWVDFLMNRAVADDDTKFEVLYPASYHRYEGSPDSITYMADYIVLAPYRLLDLINEGRVEIHKYDIDDGEICASVSMHLIRSVLDTNVYDRIVVAAKKNEYRAIFKVINKLYPNQVIDFRVIE